MTGEAVTRRLVAIFYADVAGYSRLTGADEVGTHRRVMAMLDDVTARITAAGGTVLRYAGDAILATFPSVVLAVDTSEAIQAGLAERHGGMPEDGQVRIRIGINLGDVIEDRGEVYGEGVNLAARLEAAAEPGGICISGVTHDQCRGKCRVTFRDGGAQEFKNIAVPVHVFHWTPGTGTTATTPSRARAAPNDRATIAVLPFTNMSGDPEQEYFSDGITEDIITELSRFRGLSVVARNSSFVFKGKAADVKEVGRKLGADYVLEGSVRKAGARIRITGQLIDTATGSHVWAERYDGMLEDIFDAQDEVVRAVAGTIPGFLDRIAVERLRTAAAANPTAYDCELRARWAFGHWNEGLAVALEWYARAIEADPNYALAHAGIAMTYAYGLYVLGLPPDIALAKARDHAQIAVRLNDRDARVLAYAAFSHHVGCEPTLALHYAERAVALNANDPFALYVMACALTYGGQPEAALAWYERSERLEPYASDDQRLDTLCDCYFLLGDYQKILDIHGVIRVMPPYYLMVRAATYAKLGEIAKAQEALESFHNTRPPEHDPTTFITYQMRMFARQEDRDHWLDGYRRAGFDA